MSSFLTSVKAKPSRFFPLHVDWFHALWLSSAYPIPQIASTGLASTSVLGYVENSIPFSFSFWPNWKIKSQNQLINSNHNHNNNNNNNNNKSIYQVQNLVHRDYSKCTHTHTQAPPPHTHTCTHALTHTGTHTHGHTDYTSLIYTAKNRQQTDLRWMKTAAWSRKRGRSTVFGKETFLGYTSMSPERVSVREEGEGHFM